MLGRIVSYPERCVGCRECELICSLVHENECNPASARLHVAKDPFTGLSAIEVKASCDICNGSPECVRWCPIGVLKFVKE